MKRKSSACYENNKLKLKKMDQIILKRVENILDFPNEILILFFEYLHPSDRRVISQCCKLFLDLWLREKFIGDRRLVFDFCHLDFCVEPCEIFEKTERKYDCLVIGHANYLKDDVEISEWETYLTETVTTIELKDAFLREFPWAKFPKVRTICVENIRQLRNISDIPKNIDKLVIGEEEKSFNVYDKEILKKMMSDFFPFVSPTFRVEFYAVEENFEVLHKYQNLIEKLQINVENEGLQPHDFATICLGNLKSLVLSLTLVEKHEVETILDGLESQFPSLEYLSLEINEYIPQKNWPFLKELTLTDIASNDLPLPQNVFSDNLECLSIHIFETEDDQTGQCFFLHEPLPKKKLKKLSLYKNCVEYLDCFAAMTATFPELESFETNFNISEEHLQKLATNTTKLKSLMLLNMQTNLSFESLPNLTKLSIQYTKNPQTRRSLGQWPMMPHLRKLEITIDELNHSTVRFFQKIPAVEELKLTFNNIVQSYERDLLEALIKPLKRLTLFEIKNPIINYPGPQFVKMMVSNCKYLRKIDFKENDKGDYGRTYAWIMKKHTALRSINGTWLSDFPSVLHGFTG